MRILKLEASNVKRIVGVSVDFDPDQALVVVSGNNGEGKTSFIDCISMALGGGKEICEEPIRQGQRRASTRLEIGDHPSEPLLTVHRTWQAGKASALEVRAKEGNKVRGPQALLDQLVGPISFDPIAFAKQPGAQQLETLRQLVGLDFTDHDQARRALYDQRTAVARQVRATEGVIQSATRHADVGSQQISLEDLGRQLEAMGAQRNEQTSRKLQAAGLERDLRLLGEEIQRLGQQVVEIQKRQGAATEEFQDKVTARAEIETRIESFIEPLEEPLRDQIRSVEDINRKVRENAALDMRLAELDGVAAERDELSERIEVMDQEKRSQLEAASFPVEGLSLGDDGVLYNGHPLAQVAHSEQIRVSVAMGLAMNPRLKLLLVREGSGLDRKSEAMVAQMASDAGAQVILETTKEGPGHLIIEDGAIAK